MTHLREAEAADGPMELLLLADPSEWRVRGYLILYMKDVAASLATCERRSAPPGAFPMTTGLRPG